MLPSVADMKRGQRAMVIEIQGGHGLRRQLESMGLRPGVIITKRSAQPLRGPVTIQIGSSEVALGHGLARHILVEVLP